MLLIISYFAYIINVSIIETESPFIIISLQCLLVLLAFIKFVFFLSIIDHFSFLVQLITSIFNDMKWFVIVFTMFMCMFSLLLKLVFNGSHQEHVPLYWEGAALYLTVFFTSIGDPTSEDYIVSENHLQNQISMVTLIIMIGGHFIFLNFIIAVVN